METKTSEAQKKASAKWNASKDNITIRPDKETGAAIRAAAVAAGQSNQQYLLQAARERMERDNGLTVDTGKGAINFDGSAILPHIEKTGETVPAFLSRAVTNTIASDERMLKFGMSPTE